MLKIAVTVLVTGALVIGLAAQDRAREQKLQQAIDLLETKGDAAAAIPLLGEASRSTDESVAARAMLYLGQAQERQGLATARDTYARILSRFPAQWAVVEQAGARLKALATLTAGGSVATVAAGRRRIHPPEGIGTDWGSVSSDGQWLSFTDPNSGNLGLWQIGTERTRLLTRAACCDWKEGHAESSIWSTDGRTLAFAWRGNGLALKLVPATGGPERVLFQGPNVSIRTAKPGDVTWIMPYDWSPDGRRILAGFGTFVSAGVVGRSRLVLVDAVDGQVKALKDLGRGAPGGARFSPDGRLVVYDYAPAADDRRDIFIMASDGSGHRPLIAEAAIHETVFDWAPDGRILYATDRRGTRELYALSLRNSTPSGEAVVIARNVGETRLLGRTPDGTILTETYLQLSDVLSAPIDGDTGRATRSLSPLPRPQPGMVRSQATYSPSGTRIAFFQKPMFARATLVVQNLETGGSQTFPLAIQNPERPVWRPDEAAIAFNAAAQHDAGGERLYLLDLKSGAVSQLTEGGVQVAFSPDGRYMYHPGQAVLFRRDLADGSETVIHRGAGVNRALLMSPDGRWLATFLSGAIALVPSQGGQVREVLKTAPAGGRLMNPTTWSRDGRHLFVTVLQPGDVWRLGIWRVTVETGAVVDTGVVVTRGTINRISHGPNHELAVSVSRGEFEMWAEGASSLLRGADHSRQ